MCSYSVKRWCPQRMRYRASVVVVMTNLTRCILAQTPRYVEYGYVKTQYKWRIHLWRKWLVKRVKVTITYIYIYIHIYIWSSRLIWLLHFHLLALCTLYKCVPTEKQHILLSEYLIAWAVLLRPQVTIIHGIIGQVRTNSFTICTTDYSSFVYYAANWPAQWIDERAVAHQWHLSSLPFAIQIKQSEAW